MAAKLPNLNVGQTFGRWTVTGERIKVEKSSTWHYPVQCSCGTQRILPSGTIIHGVSTMCHSCAVKMKSKPRLSPENVLLNAVRGNYCKSAKRRGLDFSLDKKDFTELIFLNCFYCGRPPSNRQIDRGERELPLYNGLDRINNNIGYQRSNVVTCCRWCNEAKRAKTTEQFLEWVNGLHSNFERITTLLSR